MRKINRQNAPVPANLANLSPASKAHLVDHKLISNSIYAHADVKNSLQLLYFDKCYICECDVSSGKYEVEHYRPKKHFTALSYTWENLHKSCGSCNLAKERAEFFIKDANGNVTDILLLDPSSTTYNINEYLTFDIDGLAQIPNIGIDQAILEKAKNTMLYLNGHFPSEYGKELKFLRGKKIINFLRFINDSDFHECKLRLQSINRCVENYAAPAEPDLLEIDQKLCQLLSNADDIYLGDKAPFSSCTRVQAYPIFKISYSQILNIKNKMRQVLAI